VQITILSCNSEDLRMPAAGIGEPLNIAAPREELMLHLQQNHPKLDYLAPARKLTAPVLSEKLQSRAS
jgi:hypothetical protein